MRDAFFLAYGGLHWSYTAVRDLTLSQRAYFVEALTRQLAFEKQQSS